MCVYVCISEAYAMTISFPEDGTPGESRLVSPSVTVSTQGCLSFVAYFNVAEVTLRIGLSAAVTNFNYSSYDVTPLATLRYPLDANLLEAGENSRLINIHLAIPVGSYHIVIAAEGSDGGLAIWDMKQIAQCTNSREIIAYFLFRLIDVSKLDMDITYCIFIEKIDCNNSLIEALIWLHFRIFESG